MTKLKDFLHKRPSAWYMLYIPVYLLLFFIVEQLVPSTCDYWVSYLPLDDLDPLLRVLCYLLLLVVSAAHRHGHLPFANDDHSFRLYGWFIIIAFTGTLLFCLIFPNGQNLRPAEFTDPNIFTWLVGRLYHADTNTNVIPSMHVLGCMAAVFGLFRCRCTPRWAKIGVIILTVLINASTVFIKQHSILDVIIALIVSVVLYFVVFRWMDKRIGGTPLPLPEDAKT